VLTGGGGVGRRRQESDVGQCEVGRRGVGMRGVRSHGVDRAVQGQMSGMGGVGARARGRSVGCMGFGWSVGPLGLGDRSLVHHPR
jgi:hypothetical protein